MEQFDSVKSVGQALEEIEAELVVNDPHPEIKRARLKMEQEERKAQKDQEQKNWKPGFVTNRICRQLKS